MKLFRNIPFFQAENAKAGLNETFIYLIRTCEEEKSVRDTLLKILKLNAYKRKVAIRNLTDDLKRQHAPADFIEAIAYLSDDDIADSTLNKIRSM
jgi:hypothetical protein